MISREHRMTRGRLVYTAMITVALTSGWIGCQPVAHLAAKQRIAWGDQNVAANRLDAALRDFEAAAELDPKLATPYASMGNIYKKLGQYEKAISNFVEAVRRDPFSFQDALSLAQLYYFTNKLSQAAQAYLHAVDLRPLDFEARLNLGVCYQQMGQHAQAAECFAKAIEIDPTRPYAHMNLGVAYAAQGKYYEAIRAYKDSLERDSNQPQVMVNLANVYIKQGRLTLAKQTLQQAVKASPECAAAHEALGYCLLKLREFEGAAGAYEQALLHDERRPRSHAGLGSALMLQYLKDDSNKDLFDSALEHWHRSLELDPSQPQVRTLIAKYQPGKPADQDAVLLGGGLE